MVDRLRERLRASAHRPNLRVHDAYRPLEWLNVSANALLLAGRISPNPWAHLADNAPRLVVRYLHYSARLRLRLNDQRARARVRLLEWRRRLFLRVL